MPLIEIKNLSKVYREGALATPALRGINLSIEAGEFVAIMGPSGSGKSTLLHILGLLDRPTAGDFIFAGREASEFSESESARLRNHEIGFVFQAFNLLPRTSVFDNVLLPLYYSAVPESSWRDKVTRAIDSVDLAHRSSYQPSELSGGERQRVAIARALINEPRLILADEPTGNLDSKSGQMIMDIFSKLNREQGHTIILITHESEMAEFASRIIRLRDGQIELNAS